MPFLISLPLSPILNNAKNLAISKLMLANVPPPPIKERYIWVTHEVKVIYKAKAAHGFNVEYKVKVTQVRGSPGFLMPRTYRHWTEISS
jgi:acyl-CoA thioesterase FadM